MLSLVVGCGSIGKRHIRNLKAMKAGNVIAYDVSIDQCRNVEQEFGVKTHSSLDEALSQKPDIALICTPTSLHIPAAMAAARKGCHLFIEKPLSHTLEGVDELIEIVAQKKLISLVGCNMRFYHGPRKVKEIIDSGIIGRIFSARIQTSSFLPTLRPNYKNSYAAKGDLGGGCVLDSIHEIDLAIWYLGDIKSVYSITRNMGALDIETEEQSEIICEFQSGTIGSIHLDYISRTYERTNQIIGENGSIFWDFIKGSVKVYNADGDKWEVYDQPWNYDINQMYIDELIYFLSHISDGQSTFNSLEEAKKTLEFVAIIKESSKVNKPIIIGN